ncbi:MAG: BPL-N domain-containing protein [Bacteroidales bacterium]|jgi:glutamine amidotransferase-like uncharacterized protein|nr:BPL-N domain-containing protein [Bacteroidales bacterium]
MRTIRFKVFVLIISVMQLPLQSQGFYKDIFMDGGIKLTSREDLPAAIYLDLSMEYFASQRYSSTFPPTRLDTIIQNQLFIGCETDINGVLLYPDGQPRFRVIYINGGTATNHGNSLGEEGRSRIRDFVANGGSFVGTCAGAFLASDGTISDSLKPRAAYLGVWPGQTHSTGLTNSSTGMLIEKDSPLLKYFDFGGDMYIDSVRHNGGCFAYTRGQRYPAETEVLLRYDYTKTTTGTRKIHNEISAWAYKASPVSGRVIAIGSHPEGVGSGERLDLMAALLLYAIEGNGTPVLKGDLEKNKVRNMFKTTHDNDPSLTMIGDRQYHHFRVTIPRGAKDITVILNGAEDYDLNLYMRKGDFAAKREADYRDVSPGAAKQFTFKTLPEGEWYIAVECQTTVETIKTEWGVAYTGKTEVLNGVPYTIKVDWK